jgi:hypothetical protein
MSFPRVILHPEVAGGLYFFLTTQGGMIRPTFFGRENIKKEKDIVEKKGEG